MISEKELQEQKYISEQRISNIDKDIKTLAGKLISVRGKDDLATYADLKSALELEKDVLKTIEYYLSIFKYLPLVELPTEATARNVTSKQLDAIQEALKDPDLPGELVEKLKEAQIACSSHLRYSRLFTPGR